MADDIASLNVEFSSRGYGRVQSQLERMEKQGSQTERTIARLTRQLEQMNRVLDKVAIGYAGLAGAAGTAVGALALLAGWQSQVVKNAHRMAAQLGVTTGQLQAFAFAASHAGVQMQDAAEMIKDWNENLMEAARTGGQLATILNDIGLSAQKLLKLDPVQRLLKLGEAVEGLPAGRQAFIFEQMANNMSRLLPLLDNTGRSLRELVNAAYELNVANSKLEVQKVLKFWRAWNRIKDTIIGVVRTLTIQLAPVLAKVANNFADFVKMNLKNGNIQTFFSNLTEYADQFLDKLEQISRILLALGGATLGARAGAAVGSVFGPVGTLVGGTIGTVAGALSGYFSPEILAALYSDEALMSRLEKLNHRYNKLIQKQMKLNAAVARYRQGGVLPYEQEAINALQNKLDGIDARIERTLNRIHKLNKAAKTDPGSDPGSGSSSGSNSGFDSGSTTTTEVIRLGPRPEISSTFERARKAMQQFDRSVTTAEEVREKYDRMAKYARIYYDRAEKQAHVLARIQKREAMAVARVTGKQYDRMSQFAIEAARNIENVLGSSLTRALSGHFDSILDLWVNMIKRMAVQATAANLAQALFGRNYARQGISSSSIIGTIGSAITDVFAGMFATGGTIPAGQWGIAGEAGPELVSGPAQVTPIQPATGDDVTINLSVDYHEQPGVSEEQREKQHQEFQQGLANTIKQVMITDVHERGPVSRQLQGTYGLSRQGVT